MSLRVYVQQASHIALSHAQNTTSQHLEYMQIHLIRVCKIHTFGSSACVAYTCVSVSSNSLQFWFCSTFLSFHM